MKNTLLIFAISAAAITLSCSGGQTAKNSAKNANAEVQKGVKPIPDPEIAVIEMENSAAFGTIKIELYSNVAPKMVARFKELANNGYYDGIAFHRINETVIQAGNADTKPGRVLNPMKEADSGEPNIPAEFSDVPFDTGMVGAARLGTDVNSQNAQFFIMLKREPAFDSKYTVFGKVIEGMNNVRTISGVQPKEGERPVEPVRIKHISIVPRDQTK
jgi:cyclophilin family peptidyl-prolyl cis-trans isomerase